MATILIVDDQDRYIELCRRAIPEHRYLGPARSWAETEAMVQRYSDRIDLVLLDVHMDRPAEELLGATEGMSARELAKLRRWQGVHILGALREARPDLPVVLMTSQDELTLERSAERLNAQEYTYFLDDDYVDARALKGQIAGILAARRGEEADGPVYWGSSLEMRQVRQRLRVLARGRLPVVLQGPTGTGKSLIARHFVHPQSGRPGAFVALDLSTVPRELIAAHLFGSVRGAYTGSVADRAGAFETANQGTLFLDEVGNLPLETQKMLLTVLQEGVVTRLGESRERPVDVKLVVATNEDVRENVRNGSFRADLFMRLNPATAIHLPPLAARSLDLERLVSFALQAAVKRPYLREMLTDYQTAQGLGAVRVDVVCADAVPEQARGVLHLLVPTRSMELLRAHPWPGNLRELAMTLENAVLFALSEMAAVPGGERSDVVQVRPKLIRDLLRATDLGEVDVDEDGWHLTVAVQAQDTLNKVAQGCERQYFTALYIKEKGDFGAMAQVLLGNPEHARKVQLRFNQLGLKVRDFRALLR